MKTQDLIDKLSNTYTSSVLKPIKDYKSLSKAIASSGLGLNSKYEEMLKASDILKSNLFKSSFSTLEDYDKYSKPILKAIDTKNTELTQKLLNKDFTSYLKPKISETMKTLDFAKTSLNGLINAGKTNISETYASALASSLGAIGTNVDILENAKKITSTLGYIESDNFKEKIIKQQEALDEFEWEPKHDFQNIKMPKNHALNLMKDSNKLIKEQLKALINISNYVKIQNDGLARQNEITETQIKDNKQSATISFWIATASIFLSTIFSIGSAYVNYVISNKEQKSNDIQHKELLNKFSDKQNIKEQNQMLKTIVLELQKQNKMLLKIQKNEANNEKVKTKKQREEIFRKNTN